MVGIGIGVEVGTGTQDQKHLQPETIMALVALVVTKKQVAVEVFAGVIVEGKVEVDMGWKRKKQMGVVSVRISLVHVAISFVLLLISLNLS